MPYVKRSSKRLSQTKIRKRRTQLRRLHKVTGSWRVIQDEYYPEMTYQALQAFADGKRIPASDRACTALDLYADPPSLYRQLPRWFKRIPASLEYVNQKKAQISDMQAEAKRQRMTKD